MGQCLAEVDRVSDIAEQERADYKGRLLAKCNQSQNVGEPTHQEDRRVEDLQRPPVADAEVQAAYPVLE